MGHPGLHGHAGMGAPAAWQGMGSGFFGELNQATPSGVSLAGLPAESCRAFPRFYAVPHGISRRRLPALSCRAPTLSMPRLWHFPSLWSGEGGGGWWRGAAGVPEITGGSGGLGHLGRYRLAGRGTPAAWQGSGRGPAAGERTEARGRAWVRVFAGNSTRLRLPTILCRASRQIPTALSSASLRCPRPIHASPSDASRLRPRPIPAAPWALPGGDEGVACGAPFRLAPLAVCGKEGRER